MDVSIIIAAYDPPPALSRMLRALLCDTGAEAPSREVLVVDNHPRRTSEPLVAPFFGAGACLLWEPRRGKCRAVNRAIREAAGTVLHFTDQDNVAGERYLSNLWRAFRADASLAVLTGRVEPAGGAPELTVKRSLVREEHVYPLVPAVAGHGNNLSIRRDVLAQVGLFDTRFGPGTFVGAGEDTDLIYRLARAGHRIVYEPSVCNIHEHGRTDAAAVRRARSAYARGRGAFTMKHLRQGDAFAARLLYWELRPCLAACARGGRGDYPEAWLNLRGLLAGIAWMATAGMRGCRDEGVKG